MASIDEINTVNPSWRIERKKESDAKDPKKQKAQKEQRNSRKNQQPDDGRPHIDKYA